MKGIDFTPDMHRAIREVRKSMTRRVAKCPKGHPYPSEWQEHGNPVMCSDGWVWSYGHDENDNPIDYPLSPKYKVGDRVFVREAWCAHSSMDNLKPSEIPTLSAVHYMEDGPKPVWGGRTRNKRFMPAWASRTAFDITGVRVERVNEISERDACDEGTGEMLAEREHWDGDPDAYRKCFRELWESIHGQGAWIRNDWVFVYEFKVVQNA